MKACAWLWLASSVLVSACQGSTQPDSAYLKLSGPKTAPADGTDLEIVIEAIDAHGSPGTGLVLLEADQGILDGEPGSATVSVSNGWARVAYRCDYLQDHACSGTARITAHWEDAVARLTTCLFPSCAGLGKDCDAVTSACGQTLECGVCAKPLRCAGAGTPNVCEQPPFEPACGPTGWCWENPVPRGGAYSSVAASAPDDIWAGTWDGQFVRWNGSRWLGISSPSTVAILAILASTRNDATAVDYHGRVLRWDGAAWRHVNDWDGFLLENAAVVSPQDIWAVELQPLATCPAPPGHVLRWDGAHWSQVPHPAGSPDGPWALSAEDVWANAVCGGEVTRWAGANWTPMGGAGCMGTLWGFSPADLWAGTCHWDGAKWRETLSDLGYENRYSGVGGAASNDLWALGGGNELGGTQHGLFYTRHWDGATWSKVDTLLDFDLQYVWGSSPNDLMALGSSGIARWDGARWSEVSRAAQGSRYADLAAVCSASPTEAFAAGGIGFGGDATGYLMHSDASGRWVAQPATAGGELSGLWCHESGTVWAVGTGGRVVRREGETWAQLSVGGSVDLEEAWGTGPDDVWVVGAQTAFHWDGQSFHPWPARSEPAYSYGLKAVFGTGPSDVWAVGAGPLFHFDGASWVAFDNPSGVLLLDVWFSGPDDGWAVGTDGTILRFDGSSWQKAPNPVDGQHFNELRGVSGRSATDVWAVGNDALLHWDGARWSLVDSGLHAAHSSLRSVDVDRWGQVRIVGIGGTVLRLSE